MFRQGNNMEIEISDIARLIQTNIRTYKSITQGELPSKIILPRIYEAEVLKHSGLMRISIQVDLYDENKTVEIEGNEGGEDV